MVVKCINLQNSSPYPKSIRISKKVLFAIAMYTNSQLECELLLHMTYGASAEDQREFALPYPRPRFGVQEFHALSAKWHLSVCQTDLFLVNRKYLFRSAKHIPDKADFPMTFCFVC